MTFKLESTAFEHGAEIPKRYTTDGDDRSPHLRWSGAPEQTKTYALIVHDPDAPSGDFTHWVIFNIPSVRLELPEDTPHRGDLSDGSVQGHNDFDRDGYGGPKPPPGKPHHYHFELYALDAPVPLKYGASRSAVEEAIKGHVLAKAELIGTYGKAA